MCIDVACVACCMCRTRTHEVYASVLIDTFVRVRRWPLFERIEFVVVHESPGGVSPW